jgi:hypothetical protein
MQLDTIENTTVVEVLQGTFATHTRTHAEHLAKDYIIENPKEVADFIGDNLFLLQLLEEIPTKIRTHFGKEQELILQFFADPEDVNWHRLLVSVQTKSAKDSRPKLDKFDEDWWIDNEERSDSKILINLEFVK